MTTSYNQSKTYESKYWNKKPVMNFKSNNFQTVVRKIQNIESDVNMYTKLPEGYSWNNINVCDNEFSKVCDFLNQHFFTGTIRQQIDANRICWEMNNTGFFLCINGPNNEIVGTVGFTKRKIQIHDKQIEVYEPMYLCSNKKYRGTGIPRVLIDESIRLSNLNGVDQGIFCNNRIVGKPIATIRQYQRPLNYKKLRQHNFIEIIGVDDETAHAKAKINLKPNKNYVVAENTEENVNTVYELYNEYMTSFSFHLILSKDEVRNYMFNDKYVKTLFVMNDNKVVDFITYNTYNVTDSECKDENDKIIKVANILMYSANKVTSDILFTNTMKQLAYDKIHLVYLNDHMHSNEILLSNIKDANEDTDDDEVNTNYDMNFIKTGKKTFISLFNIETSTFKQNTFSWMLF